MNKIAIITTTFNSAKFLPDAITSVQKSILDNSFSIEHIVIDDASTDDTKKLLNGLNYPNVKTIFNEKNLGPSKSRNKAMQTSDADYFYILDADDLLIQNSIHYMFEQTQNGKIPWVFGDHITVDQNLSYVLGQDFYGRKFKTVDQVLHALFTNRHFFQQTSLFSKKLFNDVEGYREDLKTGEDVDLFLRFILTGVVPKFAPITTHLRRIHQNNLSSQYLKDHNRYFQDLKSYFSTYKEEVLKLLSPANQSEVQNFITNLPL